MNEVFVLVVSVVGIAIFFAVPLTVVYFDKQGEKMTITETLKKYPHNLSIGEDQFTDLLHLCYRLSKEDCGLERFMQKLIYRYGGTLTKALIAYLTNTL